MDIALETKDLSKDFDGVEAVKSINLKINSGQIYGLVGPDGAGKTTTLRLLTTVMSPSSGSASVLGMDIIKGADKIKERIGYMSQQFSLYGDLTVEENLNFYADLYRVPKREREKRKIELYDFSKLEPFKTRLAGNLSGGMKKKLALACTLIHTPELLFLDEPTTGVDPLSRRELWRILYSLVPKITIVVSTPYMDEAERCNEVGLMHNGSILLSSDPEEIKEKLKGKILDVKCVNLWKARDELKDLPQVKKVELFGDSLHVEVQDAQADKDAIRTKLSETGIEVLDIREALPNLEDVFVSMMTER